MTTRRLPESLREMVVLVVDDLQPNLAAIEALLSTAGLTHIVTCDRSDQALATYRDARPDLVLLDWHMPGKDGHDVLCELRTVIGPEEYLPIIVLTADATTPTRDTALDAGATDFLTKPIDPGEAVLRVRNLLEARALHRRLVDRNAQLTGQLEASDRRERSARAAYEETLARVRAILASRRLRTVYQPVVDLDSGRVIGAEALSRFPDASLPPDLWFADAHAVGLGAELERLAVATALEGLDRLPAHAFLSINVSATTVCDPAIEAVLAVAPGNRVVLELTEHTRVVDYDAVVSRFDELRLQGIRVAVDDAGAGYAGLQHILRLRPDVIKLDRDLITHVDTDPARRALVASQVAFGREVGATITAEGIETEQEHDALRSLGVPWGQGYLLGRPDPLPLRVGSSTGQPR